MYQAMKGLLISFLKLFQAKEITVTDISGGCGAMYEIMIETSEFKGLTTIKQHRLITELLKNEIKDMHGLTIHTSIPKGEQIVKLNMTTYYIVGYNKDN